MATATPDPDPVSEAIRFAEEYGYTEWSTAQDAYNRVRMRVFDLERFIQNLAAAGRVTPDEMRGELSMEPREDA